MVRPLFVLALALPLLACPVGRVRADEAGAVQLPPPRPFLVVPFTATAPSLSGDPADPAWNHAATVPALDFALGSVAGAARYRTTVKVMWDADFLYFRVLVDDDLIPHVAAHGRDVDLTGDDLVTLQIDPQGNAHHWFQIEISANNDVRDESFSVSGKLDSDAQFGLTQDVIQHALKRSIAWQIDGLQTATRATRSGWLADVAIPATPLLAQSEATQFATSETFRANVMRYQYADAPSPLDPPQKFVMDWAPVGAGKEEYSPEGMGFLQLSGGPGAPPAAQGARP